MICIIDRFTENEMGVKLLIHSCLIGLETTNAEIVSKEHGRLVQSKAN